MGTDKSQLAVRAVVAIYREFEQIARRSDISMAQYRLLLYLRNGPQRAGAIAAAAELAKPTVSLAVSGLRERGWVESGGDTDGRASLVVITAAGKARMDRFEKELSQSMGAMLAPKDLGGLTEVLAQAYAAMAISREERMKTVERGLAE